MLLLIIVSLSLHLPLAMSLDFNIKIRNFICCIVRGLHCICIRCIQTRWCSSPSRMSLCRSIL